MENRRVVVTGMGVVTPIGRTLESFWQNLVSGESGVDLITLFDASNFPVRFAAEVKEEDINAKNFSKEDDKSRYFCRATKFCIAAAKMAVEDSGITFLEISDRTGIFIGRERGQLDFDLVNGYILSAKDETKSELIGYNRLVALTQNLKHIFFRGLPSLGANYISGLVNAGGVVNTICGACASSVQSIGEAYRYLKRGRGNVALAGGADSQIHPFGIIGLHMLGALSPNNGDYKKASRPFDLNRDGFVVGEGSGMLILETLEHARKRDAEIYGELIGYGTSCDAFRITDEPEDARGAVASMENCLLDAKIRAEEVDYINAHGTSTRLNDKIETLAIKKVFKEKALGVPISSNKSMIGHLLPASGAVETIASLLTMRYNLIPPTINYQEKDPACDLDYVPNEAREAKVNIVMKNSFGFGGINASLLLRKL